MVHHENVDAADPYPDVLLSLDQVLQVARLPLNWTLTPAEKKINTQVLLALEAIKNWESPAYHGMFLRSAIAAARMEEIRDRRSREDWVPISEESSVFELLLKIPMYKWPIPRDKACFLRGSIRYSVEEPHLSKFLGKWDKCFSAQTSRIATQEQRTSRET
jgi:hypothetical protein